MFNAVPSIISYSSTCALGEMKPSAGPAVLLPCYARVANIRLISSLIPEELPRLYYIDGPQPRDIHNVASVRAAVHQILRPTRDKAIILTTNHGPDSVIESGVTEVLKTSSSVIVIEDDVIPHPQFFGYCEDFFARVSLISNIQVGCGFNPFKTFLGLSLSTTFVPWGWCITRESWELYLSFRNNLSLLSPSEALQFLWLNYLHHHQPGNVESHYWHSCFHRLMVPDTYTWDIAISAWLKATNNFCSFPSQHLAVNIGVTGVHTNSSRWYHRAVMAEQRITAKMAGIGSSPLYNRALEHAFGYKMYHPRLPYVSKLLLRPLMPLIKRVHSIISRSS